MTDSITIIGSTQPHTSVSTYQLNEPLWVTKFKEWIDKRCEESVQNRKPKVRNTIQNTSQLWSYHYHCNQRYCNTDVKLSLRSNDSESKSTNLSYSLTLEIEDGAGSAHSKVKFSLNKAETIQFLKSLIDCELDKVKSVSSICVFSKLRLGVKYVVEFVQDEEEQVELKEEATPAVNTEHELVSWNFQLSVQTDEAIGACSVKLVFKFTEYGCSANEELKRMKTFASDALKDIQEGANEHQA